MRPENVQKRIEERKLLTEKTCSKCKETKPIERFSFIDKEKFIYNCYCKKCANRKTYERKKKQRKNGKKFISRNPDSKLWSRLKIKFNLSKEEYLNLLASQNNKCKICNNPPLPYKRLGVDHCHTTLAVRGLLCSGCNSGLGHFKDRSDLLQAAIEYLKETNSDKTP